MVLRADEKRMFFLCQSVSPESDVLFYMLYWCDSIIPTTGLYGTPLEWRDTFVSVGDTGVIHAVSGRSVWSSLSEVNTLHFQCLLHHITWFLKDGIVDV